MIVSLAVQKKTGESEKVYLTVMRNQEAVVHEVGRSRRNIAIKPKLLLVYCVKVHYVSF